MNAMKCDRCGKYIDGRDIPTIRGWRTETARMTGSPILKMDLCNECYEALEEFLVNGKEKKTCVDCGFFSDREYYADNTVSVSAVACGSCTKCQRNITSTNPHAEVPSWCPLKGDEDE